MFKTKLLASILSITAVLFTHVGIVFASPAAQETTPITGTITGIQTETEVNSVTTVLVTVEDDRGTTQTIRISMETATSLGLLALDPVTNEPVLDPVTNEPLVDQTKINQPIEIDPATVIPDAQLAEEPVHLISWLLAEFFGEDPLVVEGYHQDGFGFGVIAQALWISRNLTSIEDMTGNASLAADILAVKQDKNYESFIEAHPEYLEQFSGDTISNWGQFKKALLGKKNNLGVIVSGQVENDDSTEDDLTQQENGMGRGNGRDNNPGKGKGRNK